MADLRQAFEYAGKNPTSDFAKDLEKLASSGALDVDAKKFGIDLSPFKPKPVATVTEKVKATAGGIAKGLGGTIGLPVIGWAGRKIVEALPEDVTFGGLSKTQMLDNLDKSPKLQEQFDTMMSKEKAPDVFKTAETVGLIAGLAPAGVSLGAKLAKTELGAKAVETVASVVRPVRDFTLGTVETGVKAVKATGTKAKDIYKGVDSAELTDVIMAPEVAPFVQASPASVKTIEEALKQGFEPKRVKFLASVSDADKVTMREMKALAEEAGTNERITRRPMDIVGENGVKIIRNVSNVNQKAGAEVDAVARSLSGQAVDAQIVYTEAVTRLQRSGVQFLAGGNMVFENSVFKKTPALAKKLQSALSDIPTGQADAYEVHKFKKSLDNLINYEATGGKGLSSEAISILKSVRASADNVLDSNFEDYNKANTTFAKTRELMDEAYSIVGKETDFLTKQGAEDFGQSLRSLFSNNKSRGRVGTFLQNLQKTSDEFGVGTDQNIVDQGLFANVLEDIYGNPAVTGIQGQMGKALSRGAEFADAPIRSTLQLGIDKAEQLRGITPEAKKKVLDLFLMGK